MFTAIVVISGVYFIKTVYDKQAIRMENEKLKNENLQSQYESLKNQVSPHFLFNSLTALKELINQNPASAQNYISHLSLVMRYTLQSNESMTQCLRDEMQVADSYLFLVKIRFGANLIIEKNIDHGYDFHLLPPLALQTLIENAIKHNEISKRFPLTIKMETTENQCLRVTNTLQEKITPEFSTGKGLTNLSRQYQFLSGNDITISKKNQSFIVDLPLLSPQNDKSFNS
jgi:LytS/YehU family sensor histidine kinase